MRLFLWWLLLIFGGITTSSAEDWEGNGDNGFGLCWFWVGSDLGNVFNVNFPSLGMPKFKLCKHPNGGSLQIGLDDNYMRVRVSDLFAQIPYNKYNIPTVDYKIKGYKGNLKYNITKWTPDGPGFVLEADMFEPLLRDTKYPWELEEKTVGGQFKMKYDPWTPQTPYTIEFRLIGNAFTEALMEASHPRDTFSIPERVTIRDLQYMDAHANVRFDPLNIADAAANLSIILKGDVENELQPNVTDEKDIFGRKGNYSLSSSLAVIKVVPPTRSERQPRMTAIWDISEDIMYEEGRPEFSRIPRNNRLFKKSIVLDGMINLTEQGDRIAVLKATDADTGNTFGRIQARKVDVENLRLEAFYNGKQQAALNVQQQPGGITNVTYEDIVTDEMCNDNSTSHDRNAYSSKCNVSRLLDTVVNDEVMELKIYQDLVYAIVEPMRLTPYLDEAEREWKTLKEGKQWENGWHERQIADGSLFDIKLERKNDIVQCSTNLAFLGHKIIGFRGLIKQDEESRNTQIQLARTYTPEALLGYHRYTYEPNEYIPDEDPSYEDSGYNNTDYSNYEERLEGRYGRYNKTEEYFGQYYKLFDNVREYAEVEDILNLEVKPTSGNTTDQYTVELKDNNDNKLSFDGWFGLANKIQEAVADMVPDIKRYLEDKQFDYEFMNYSNLTSAIPNFLHMHV